jgi:cytochrome c
LVEFVRQRRRHLAHGSHEQRPVQGLQESLTEGIVKGRPTMSEFRLDPGQEKDVIAYLKSLEQ